MKSKKAVEDGKAVRKRETTGKREFAMTPDEVVSTIRQHIRKALGDSAENGADVYASSGYFWIQMNCDTKPWGRKIRDTFWKQAFAEGVNLRRHSIGLALRAMHGEVLTGG